MFIKVMETIIRLKNPNKLVREANFRSSPNRNDLKESAQL